MLCTVRKRLSTPAVSVSNTQVVRVQLANLELIRQTSYVGGGGCE
jgi:hypothetical protein